MLYEVITIIKSGRNVIQSRMLVMGITFKEDVSDIRNSKVADVIHELESYGIRIDVMDPYADPEEVEHEYQIKLTDSPSCTYDGIILAVSHKVV